MVAFKALTVLMAVTAATAQGLPKCTKAGTAFCATPANGTSTSNIILRCAKDSGTAQPGNCNDNLAGVPPVGVKLFAPCWESSPTAGDAECVFNCVSVKAPNGTKIYPVGCNKTLESTSASGATTTSSAVLTSSLITTAPGPVITSNATTAPVWTGTSSTGAPIATGAGVAIIADAWPVVALMGGALIL